MKSLYKRLMLLFTFIMIAFSPIKVYAEIIEQDNLKVKLQIENVEDEVKAILTITNIGIRNIHNVSMENIIPEGLSIKDKNYLIQEIGEIEAGETKTYEFYYKVDNEITDDEGVNRPEIDDENAPTTDDSINTGGGSNDTTTDDSINTGGGSNDTTTDDSINIGGGSNDTTMDDSTNNGDGGDDTHEIDDSITTGDKVETGDSNIILILIIVIITCALFIVLLLNKKVRSLLICLGLLTSVFEGGIIVQATELSNKEIVVQEAAKKEIVVQEDIVIEDKLYTVEMIVDYYIPSNEVVAEGSIITRGQWISNLIETLDLKSQYEINWDEVEYPFSDIEGTQYEEDILYAYVNNILINEGDLFNPNDIATREFATVTAVKALGFMGNQDIKCEDANEITYSKEVEVAVTLGLLPLEKNNFYPLRGLTESEFHYLTDGIKNILKSSEIDENYNNTFEYKDGVIKLDEDVSYKINESTITFESDELLSNLKVGDIIVLSNEVPYKLTSVTVNENIVVVETEQPTMEETLDYIDVQGYAVGDLSEFIPEEGVEVIENDIPERGVSVDPVGKTLTVKIDKKHPDNPNKELVSGKITIKVPKVEYKVDMDLGLLNVDINNVYFKILEEIDIQGKFTLGDLKLNSTQKVSSVIPIGKIPVVGVPGIALVLGVSLTFDASGVVKLTYSLDGALGAQVLDNNIRSITTLRPDLNFDALELEGKAGLKLAALLEICSTWDLIDISFSGGGKVRGTLNPHLDMICFDASAFIFATLKILDDTEINKWLEIEGFEFELWHEGNSPLKIRAHWENMNEVPDCTYGEGIIKGTVAEAGDRGSIIKDALVQVYTPSGNILIEEITSDSNGQYELSLDAGNYGGTYIIKISKDGYIPFESIETVISGQETYIQTYLMVGEGADGQVASAGGKITNAVTGGSVSGITINVRPGWNNVLGDPLLTTTTNNEGKYEVILPLGNYTVEMIKEGYVTTHYNIYVLAENALNQHYTIVPNSTEMPAGDLRIVLTWGEKPRDLDSHLVGPTADGNDYFHIYFGNKKYSENDTIYADLDLDDTTSYGPETTTVYNINTEGKYSFYVHDYTNGSEPLSVQMSNSGVKVDVYKGDILYATYHIPTNTQGIYWHVFDFDAAENVIIPVNNFVDGIQDSNSNVSLVDIATPIWEVEDKLTIE